VTRAADCQSPAIVAAEYESEFYFPWNDGNAFRPIQEILRNSLVRRVHDRLKDFSRSVGALYVFLTIRGHGSQCGKQSEDGKYYKAFQHVFISL
jgi:hypothetical protein